MAEVTDAAVDLALNAGIEHQRQTPRQDRPVVWASPSRGQVRAMLEAAAPLIAARAVHDAGFDQAQLAADIIRLRVRLDDAVDEVCKRIADECVRRAKTLPPSDEQNAWFSAGGVALAAREGQERGDEGTEPG